MSGYRVTVSWGGCLGLVVSVLLLWALVFGVTWHGRHHSLGCSCERGVEVEP